MSDLVEGLRKGVWGRARRADAAIQTLMQDGADRIEAQAARIAELEAALEDMAKHIWRGDWDKLKPQTRELLDEGK